MINSPTHYNSSEIECIDAIEAMLGEEFSAYLQGNITKYLWRFKQAVKHVECVWANMLLLINM